MTEALAPRDDGTVRAPALEVVDDTPATAGRAVVDRRPIRAELLGPDALTSVGRRTTPKRAASIARKAAEVRRPYHVGVFLGLSAGLYAVSLAGVTALQSTSDRAIAETQAPGVAALEAVRAGHDELDRRLANAGSAYGSAAAGYQQAADSLTSLEQALEGLRTSVGKVTGVTSSLPSHVSLPALPSVPKTVAAAAAPAVHATTGASGKP
jgi:hypothetical protein